MKNSVAYFLTRRVFIGDIMKVQVWRKL